MVTNLLGSLTHEHEALGVGDDLARIQGLLEIVDELLLVAAELLARGAVQDLGGTGTLLLDGRQASGKDGLADESDYSVSETINVLLAHKLTRSAGVEGSNSGPLSSTLLASLVQNLGDHRLAIGILVLEHVGGNLDQEGIEDTSVPFLEDTSDLILSKTETAFENVVGLSDQLHITVFDT